MEDVWQVLARSLSESDRSRLTRLRKLIFRHPVVGVYVSWKKWWQKEVHMEWQRSGGRMADTMRLIYILPKTDLESQIEDVFIM